MSELTQKAYPRFTSVWWTGKDFLQKMQTIDGNMGFFLAFPQDKPIPDIVRSGTILLLTLQFLDRNLEFSVHARVLQRHQDNEQQGVNVVCFPEEKQRQQLILDCARGKEVTFTKRQSERMPCFFPVLATLKDQSSHKTWALNISKHGIFIALKQNVSPDDFVSMQLEFPDQKELFAIQGRIKAVVTESVQPGIGLEFLFESGEQRNELIKHIARMRRINSGMERKDLSQNSPEFSDLIDSLK